MRFSRGIKKIKIDANIVLWPIAHLFFLVFYIFNVFFIIINKRKKWESGQKARIPYSHGRFQLAIFILKVGKKWANGHF
jgi:hypothetical protein